MGNNEVFEAELLNIAKKKVKHLFNIYYAKMKLPSCKKINLPLIIHTPNKNFCTCNLANRPYQIIGNKINLEINLSNFTNSI